MSLVDIIAGPVLKIIDKLIPDPQAKAQAQLELIKLQQAGEFKQLEADLQLELAQANINLEEAKSESLFKSGWRPFVGWVCGSGFAYMLVVRPILPWLFTALGGHPPEMPAVDLAVLTTTLGAILGVGTMRSYDKKQGTA